MNREKLGKNSVVQDKAPFSVPSGSLGIKPRKKDCQSSDGMRENGKASK